MFYAHRPRPDIFRLHFTFKCLYFEKLVVALVTLNKWAPFERRLERGHLRALLGITACFKKCSTFRFPFIIEVPFDISKLFNCRILSIFTTHSCVVGTSTHKLSCAVSLQSTYVDYFFLIYFSYAYIRTGTLKINECCLICIVCVHGSWNQGLCMKFVQCQILKMVGWKRNECTQSSNFIRKNIFIYEKYNDYGGSPIRLAGCGIGLLF